MGRKREHPVARTRPEQTHRPSTQHTHTPKKMFCSTVLIAALAATQGASASRQLQISLDSLDSGIANGLSTMGPKALGIKSPPLDIAAGVQHAFHHDNYVAVNLPHFGRKLQDGGIPLSVNGGDGTTSLGDEVMDLLPHMEKIPPQGLDMRPLYELEHEAPDFENEPYPRTGVDFAAGPQDTVNIAQGTTIDDVIAAPDNATAANATDATDAADAADADTITADDADADVLGLDSDQVKVGRRNSRSASTASTAASRTPPPPWDPRPSASRHHRSMWPREFSPPSATTTSWPSSSHTLES